MGSIIRSTRTLFYSLLYLNSRTGFNGVKYVHSWAVLRLCCHGFASCVAAQQTKTKKKRFTSQIWVSDVTFVTFFGDKKCDAFHFWEDCDALAHENIFLN